jgi:cyclopropane fatty-acyl-phospholipid synthase-like methyltransferase
LNSIRDIKEKDKMKQEDIFWKNQIKRYNSFLKRNPGKIYEDYDPLKCAIFLRLSENFLNLTKKPKVLELGCGSGIALCYLAKKGSKCVGVDYSSYALKFAKRLAKEKGVEKRVKLMKKDMHKVDFHSDFDIVFNSGVIEHLNLTDQRRLINKMKSSSKKYVFILIPNESPRLQFKRFIQVWKKRKRYYNIPHKKVDILKLFKDNDIRIIDEDGFGIYTAWQVLEDFKEDFEEINNKIKKYMNKKEKEELKEFPHMKYTSSQIKMLAGLEKKVPKAYRIKYGFLRMYLGKIKSPR